METKSSSEYAQLLLFSLITSLVTYGFGLTNYTLSIDSESPIYADFAMPMGRWGTNLVRYHIFEGHLPYFTLLLGLILMSLTTVELCRIFQFKKISGFLFCALFLSFPQLSYQLIFTMQADVVPLGFLCSALSISVFNAGSEKIFTFRSIALSILSAVLIMFVLAMYQALIFIPIVIYGISFLQKTYSENFILKDELYKALHFALILLIGAILYYISVKILCPPVEGGYLSSYVSGNSNQRVSDFYNLWTAHLKGNTYYGEKIFLIVPFLCLVLLVKFALEKKLFLYRFVALLLLLLLPFFISFFITSGYNPPRIYVASGIVFAFLIVHTFRDFAFPKAVVVMCGIICLANIYFVTQLFYSSYRIYNHDQDVARKIVSVLESKYPAFDPKVNYVYFHGHLPLDHHDKYRLENSEVFGGSFFTWDNGNNYRIINFLNFTDIANYKMIDNKEVYLGIKDSILTLPVWPSPESVKLINNVAVIKLGTEKGAPLYVE